MTVWKKPECSNGRSDIHWVVIAPFARAQCIPLVIQQNYHVSLRPFGKNWCIPVVIHAANRFL